MSGVVIAVSLSSGHGLAKEISPVIRLIAGIGVDGDAHAGETVQHLSRMRRTPGAPNLRQVHLIAAELIDELNTRGFGVAPGQMGENVTTRGVDLLGLPAGTRLGLGGQAVVEVTGLRKPCVQLDRFREGLMKAMVESDPDAGVPFRTGIMATVVEGGEVRPDDLIAVELPAGPPRRLEPV